MKEFKSKIDELLDHNLHFFVPHVNNLLSYYCYYLSLENPNLGINVFYEGLALFYDPKIRVKKLTILKRKIMSNLIGLNYKYIESLFPKELRELAKVYSPSIEFTSPFKQVCEFEFPIKFDLNNKVLGNSQKSLILGCPLMNNEQMEKTFDTICRVYNLNTDENYLFKPHFEALKGAISELKQFISNHKYPIEILEGKKNMPIELLIEEGLNINNIHSIYISSALINLKLMFGNSMQIYVYNVPKNKKIKEISEKLGIVFC
ncbi:hypothetical protein [Sphingobacterium sp. NPDC055346]